MLEYMNSENRKIVETVFFWLFLPPKKVNNVFMYNLLTICPTDKRY